MLAFTGADHLYAHRNRVGVLNPAMRDAVWKMPGEERASLLELRRSGITHVMLEHDFLQTNGFGADARWTDYALTSPGTRDRYFELLYDDGKTALYRIGWELLDGLDGGARTSGARAP